MNHPRLLGGPTFCLVISTVLLFGRSSAVAQPSTGEIDVKVNVPAAIAVDGTHVGDAPLQKPLKVSPGEHVVSAQAAGYAEARQQVSVPAQGGVGVTLELEPAEAKPAHVTVYSPLQGVEVRVDDVVMGKTPLPAPLSVTPGEHVFELARPGYMGLRRTLKLGDGVYATVAYDPQEDPDDESPRGQLRLVDAVANVSVTIDGHARGTYRGPIRLPAGPHLVRLEQTGYEPLERSAEVPEGGEATVMAAMQATAEVRGAAAARSTTYRRWAIAALVSGAVVTGGALALALWSNSKISPAENNLSTIQQDAVPGGKGSCDPSTGLDSARSLVCQQRLVNAQNEVDKYRGWRLDGFIGVGVGAALVATGITLLVVAPRAGADDGATRQSALLVPQVFAGRNGMGVGLHARF